MNSSLNPRKEIQNLLRKKSNSFCADCFDSCALYIDLINFIFLCRDCAEMHKQLGFKIKNPITDEFSYEEIEKIKQSDNETFNSTWMGLYQSKSTKIPFGASNQERKSFIIDKYMNKKWFSPIPHKFNQSFYNRNHLDIQESLDYSDNVLDSESETLETSEITSPSDSNFFGLSQKENEIIITSPLSISAKQDDKESIGAYSFNDEEESKFEYEVPIYDLDNDEDDMDDQIELNSFSSQEQNYDQQNQSNYLYDQTSPQSCRLVNNQTDDDLSFCKQKMKRKRKSQTVNDQADIPIDSHFSRSGKSEILENTLSPTPCGSIMDHYGLRLEKERAALSRDANYIKAKENFVNIKILCLMIMIVLIALFLIELKK